MPVTLRRAALAAALVLLSPAAVPARADQTLAASGPYTLTQSLVDADAAYLGWAAGRTLTADQQNRLSALDVARFRRDPAWTVKALGGEQKNLPVFQTFAAQTQDSLRRTVLRDLPDFQATHLTPDEARQMQQIVAGTSVSPPPAVDPAPPAVPRPAPAVAAATGRPLTLTAAQLPLRSGKFTLTPAMVDDDLAIWQLVAGRPLSAADRQAIIAVDADLFRRDPAWVVANMRQAHKNLPGLRRGGAVGQADLRRVNLVDIYCTPQKQHLTPDDAARMQAVVGRYVPVVGVDVASDTVITARDIDACVAAARFVTSQAHVPGPGPGYRASLVGLAKDPARMGDTVSADAAAMEHNWAAFQLVWPHLSAAQRAQVMGPRVARLKRAAARKGDMTTATVEALDVCQKEAADYPYALDPRLEAYKRASDLRMGLFNQHMMEYNMQNMMRSQEDYQRGLRGEAPNPVEIPVPVP